MILPNNPCNLRNQNKSVIQTMGVVFNARVMLNPLNPDQFITYANNCPGTSNKMYKPEAEIIILFICQN